jgi:hypothetical protein
MDERLRRSVDAERLRQELDRTVHPAAAWMGSSDVAARSLTAVYCPVSSVWLSALRRSVRPIDRRRPTDSVEKIGRKAQAGRSERDAAVVISPLTF